MTSIIGRNGAYLALSCIGAFATSPALAAPGDGVDAETPADDRDIIVNGERERRGANPKNVAPLVDTPRSIVVLPSEVIEQTGSNSLQDALRTVPGITFGAAEGGNPVGDRPFIRGFEAQGSIYVDGVRDIGAQSREVFAIDTVQIVRGSDSTLGGRGSAGGSINIVSRLPRLGNSGSLLASYGNADYKRVTGDLNLQISEIAAFRVQAVYHDQDFAGRDAINSNRWGVAPSITLGLGTPTRLTASYYHLETDDLPDSGLPFAYTLGNAPGTGRIDVEPVLGRFTTIAGRAGRVDRSTFYGLVARDFRKTATDQAMIRAEHDFGGITLRNTARYSHTSQSYIFTQPDDSQGNVFGTAAANPTTGAGATRGDVLTGGLVWRRGNTRYGFAESIINQTDLYGTLDTGGIRHSFAAGAEFAFEKTRRGTFVSANGSTLAPRCNTASIARYYCTDLFAPNPNDPWVNYASDTDPTAVPIVRGAAATETQNDGRTQAVYAFDSITLVPELVLNLGARFDRFRSYLTAPGGLRFRRTDELFNWQAGLVFKPTPQTSLYASYATAATPPNSLLGEGREENALPATGAAAVLVPVASLKPQKTKSYEAGAKASLMADRLQLGVAVFQTDIANARVTSDLNTVEFIGRSRIRGVELTASGTILPGWTVFGGYSYLDPEIRDGGFTALTAPAIGTGATARPPQVVVVPSVNTGKQLPQTARHSFSGTSNLTIGRFSVGGTAIYMGRQYGGYQDNRSAVQSAAGVVTINPATRTLYRSIPDYWRFDARAAVKLNDMLELSVNAQNLTDKAYFSQVFTTHYATIAPGRTVFGTVAVRF